MPEAVRQKVISQSPVILSRLFRLITSLAAAGAVVVMLLTVCGFAGRWWWRFEQASHFRVQYLWLLVIAAAVLFVVRRRPLALIVLAAATINLATIIPIYWPARAVPSQGSRLRIVSFNVLSHNGQHEAVLDFLRQEQADIVVLMEISPAWTKSIEGLRDVYPHQQVVPRTDNFGIALLSRVRWRVVQTLELGRAEIPTIVAKLDANGHSATVVGTHPLPPGSAETAALRNEQLRDVAKLIGEQSSMTIVTGDLNVTNFSPFFHDLLRQTGLRDSRQGFGIHASWGPLPCLEIPIDHCLVSPDIAVLKRRTGLHLGSDHRPVVVELRLPLP